MAITHVEILAAEVLERAVRIHLLVRHSTRQLIVSFRKDTAQLAAAEQIQNLLEDLVIDPLLKIFPSNSSNESRIDLVKGLLETVAAIHEGALPTIPRVTEPIELRSYLRQSSETIQPDQPLVFASERLGMQVYPNSLSGLLHRIANRQNLIAKARHSLTDARELGSALLDKKYDPYDQRIDRSKRAYIAIPAVDIHNPNRWPSLWHELAHHELQRREPSLISEFEKFINGTNPNSTAFRQLCVNVAPLESEAFSDSELIGGEDTTAVEMGRDLIERWLRECWCDACGVKQAGIAFLYSQLHEFMFCFENYLTQTLRAGQKYPPAEFRVSLASNLALERLRYRTTTSESDVLSKVISAYEEEQKLFFDIAKTQQDYGPLGPSIAVLFNHYLSFLKHCIKFDDQKAFGGDISEDTFRILEDDLKDGFPIPSIPTPPGGGSRAARVSEIILAGWQNRNCDLRAQIIKLLNDISNKNDGAERMKDLIESVSTLIDRSDESIKRSIQVAEWFSILHDAQSSETGQPAFGQINSQAATSTVNHHLNIANLTASIQTGSSTPFRSQLNIGLLADDDINDLLEKERNDRNRLRVVPLIDGKRQVKGSTIDLRLGHNFEVFQSIAESAIDACNDAVDSRQDSLEVEVDFLHGLPILPGQFVLGHTLEYIKLPRNIAAQIEGRSSFARLGVQVHMTANLVEAGFDGCLTLEIHNNGPATVILYPGMRIAQLRLFRLATEASRPYDGPTNKYRGQLSHNKTKQFTDREVPIFRSARKARGIS